MQIPDRIRGMLVRRGRPAATIAGVADDIDRHGASRRDALRSRFQVLIGAVGAPMPGAKDTPSLLTALVSALTPLTAEHAWLLLSVLEARLPSEAQVQAATRAAKLDGTAAAVRLALWNGPLPRLLDAGPWRPVRVVTGETLVDVHHTARTDFATGIQRVTRQAGRRWAADHHPTIVGWTADHRALRELTAAEARRAFWGGPPVPVPDDDAVVVPFRATFLLPELAAEPDRAERQLGMARYSGCHFGLIGYDLVPVTTAETSHSGLVPGFAKNLASLRHATVIAPISEAAGGEYRGWRTMLAGIGLAGPEICPVMLPAEAPREDPAATSAAADRLLLGDLPLVLVVGSHEPRKNHLAILHAAELLWREGLQFSLTFIGGNSWNSERFMEVLAKRQLDGRPVETISAARDDLLGGAYRIARFTVFPSFNEGFGLPVAESLAVGTPVITSGFGSCKEIADAGGGALLVDPRDDHSIADAMRSLLVDDDLLARLRAEAVARPTRTWENYAAETWQALTEKKTTT